MNKSELETIELLNSALDQSTLEINTICADIKQRKSLLDAFIDSSTLPFDEQEFEKLTVKKAFLDDAYSRHENELFVAALFFVEQSLAPPVFERLVQSDERFNSIYKLLTSTKGTRDQSITEIQSRHSTDKFIQSVIQKEKTSVLSNADQQWMNFKEYVYNPPKYRKSPEDFVYTRTTFRKKENGIDPFQAVMISRQIGKTNLIPGFRKLVTKKENLARLDEMRIY